MATNWKTTLWDIILTILTLGISHIQKRKKSLKRRETKNPQSSPQKTNHLPLLWIVFHKVCMHTLFIHFCKSIYF